MEVFVVRKSLFPWQHDCLYFWQHIAAESPDAAESPETGLGRGSGGLAGQLREAVLAMTGTLEEGALCWPPADPTQVDNTMGMNRLLPEPCVQVKSLKLENILSLAFFVNF